MGPAHGQVGVDLQVEGGQQALVDRQGGERGSQAVVMPVAPGVERTAAQGDAAEAALDWAEPAHPPGPAAAPDGAAGADAFGATQTHGGDEVNRESNGLE